MKTTKLVLGVAVAALTFAGGASANEIYRWVDGNGNVHYGDRPSGAPTEQRLQLTYARTDGSAVEKRVQARLDAQTTRAEARAEAEKADQEALEAAEIAAERDKKCVETRAKLETYLQSRRLYRTDANGEREYLDDQQREEARQKVEDQINEFCS